MFAEYCVTILFSLLLQIVWKILMLKGCLDMLFSRMGRTLDSHIHWRSFTQMLLAEAFTMVVSYRECGKKLHHFPRILSFIDLFFTFYQLFHNVNQTFTFSIYSIRLEQGTVVSLLEEEGTIKGALYKTKSGKEMKAYAPLTIVCDGCFSNLRRSLCNPQVINHILSLS